MNRKMLAIAALVILFTYTFAEPFAVLVNNTRISSGTYCVQSSPTGDIKPFFQGNPDPGYYTYTQLEEDANTTIITPQALSFGENSFLLTLYFVSPSQKGHEYWLLLGTGKVSDLCPPVPGFNFNSF